MRADHEIGTAVSVLIILILVYRNLRPCCSAAGHHRSRRWSPAACCPLAEFGLARTCRRSPYERAVMIGAGTDYAVFF